MRKTFGFAQFYVACSLAVLLLNGCGNVAAQQKDEAVMWCNTGDDACAEKMRQFGNRKSDALDVAPKEWDEKFEVAIKPVVCKPPLTPKESEEGIACGERIYDSTHHVECADKSRFKLMSEDGKWHCLKLTP